MPPQFPENQPETLSAETAAAAGKPETLPNDSSSSGGGSSWQLAHEPRTDFIWSEQEEPHRERRLAIMKAHPEVKKLFGNDPITGVYVFGIVAVQFTMAYLLRDLNGSSVAFWLCAYVIGATCNHALFLAIHEIGHNLAYHSPLANRLVSMVANLPIAIPYAISFRAYHSEHHKLQGVDGYDADLPTWLEGYIVRNSFTKLLFCCTQILFYALRPLVVRVHKPTAMLVFNWVVILAFDSVVYWAFGLNPLLYFLASTYLAGSLHPLAGHFISEHYVFGNSDETFSYYGPLNALSFNVGYHNEHHDFPNVPWTRLPKVKALAPEFYDHLPHHTSWVGVLWTFITNPNIGAYNRVKRVPTERDHATAQRMALSDFKSD